MVSQAPPRARRDEAHRIERAPRALWRRNRPRTEGRGVARLPEPRAGALQGFGPEPRAPPSANPSRGPRTATGKCRVALLGRGSRLNPASRAEPRLRPRALRGEGAARGAGLRAGFSRLRLCRSQEARLPGGLDRKAHLFCFTAETCLRRPGSHLPPALRPPHSARAPPRDPPTGAGPRAGRSRKRRERLPHKPQRRPRYGCHSPECASRP